MYKSLKPFDKRWGCLHEFPKGKCECKYCGELICNVTRTLCPKESFCEKRFWFKLLRERNE